MRHILPILGLAMLAGCADLIGPNYDPAEPFNPYNRLGTWRPLGVNDANLRIMVDRPVELARGTEMIGSDGNNAARAVERYRTGRVPPAPAANSSNIGPAVTVNVAPPGPAADGSGGN